MHKLCQQFMVEIYIKIDSERFRYFDFDSIKKSCVQKILKTIVRYWRWERDETGCIKLPNDFCTIIYSQDALIDQICPSVHRQYTNHEWLAERAILVAKNVEVNELNLKIQNLLPENLVSYKSRYSLRCYWSCKLSNRVFKLIGFTRHATA